MGAFVPLYNASENVYNGMKGCQMEENMAKDQKQTRKARREAKKRAARRRKVLAVGITTVLVLAAVIAVASAGMSIAEKNQQARAAKLEAEATPVPTPKPTATPIPTPTPEPTPTPPSRTVRITATGDCTIGGNVRSDGFDYFDGFVQKNGYEYFFANVRDIFKDDDLTIINFEGTLPNDGDQNIGHGYNFAGRKEYTNILTTSSIELCNLANNHSTDFGEAGLLSTVENLEAAGLGVFGFDNFYETEINGVQVAVCGFTEWRCDLEQSVQKVKELRQRCDLLIVNMHWGAEKWNEATDEQKEWGHAMVDAGADIVIGNHSHVISCIEMYQGKYILYSLGNFCFGGNRYPDDKDCFIFQQEFYLDDENQVVDNGIKIIPCSISSITRSNNFQPTPLTGSEYDRVLKKIQRYAKVKADAMVWLDDTPYHAENTPEASASAEAISESPSESPAAA